MYPKIIVDFKKFNIVSSLGERRTMQMRKRTTTIDLALSYRDGQAT